MNQREVTLSGHIIDSLVLPKALDTIMNQGGDFKILEFEVGKRKSDISKARIVVYADSPILLDSILDELSEIGASISEIKEVELIESPKDKVVPPDFYSTTNHTTHILYDIDWILVENIEMDCMITIDKENKRASCKTISKVKKGDLIVVGREGIKVTPPQRPRGKKGVFEFMNSDVSSEKPLKSTIKNIGDEIKEIKCNGGKIAIVGGPAIVHTGSANLLSKMIKNGFVDCLFAGNALATHDIENALYGTSLGVCIKTGNVVNKGHRNHIRAINEINAQGSIKNAVENGVLKKGVMYECIKSKVPYVLAGSIRDDGPLPDVITDSIEAQELMRHYSQDVDMVIMIATMLHSIATGNIISSKVKTICVDINPSTVTKLADRGSAQVVSIVTDIGTFLPLLYQELTKK
ncbi:MAG: TIGR00300 family protein [Methanobrevibacter sp.]|jgi:lysine-ketoglutarate reductase/saccharopine dehydrogenase-like protein (TIGR00300 family)|nr:TIGR00300 family protein [Candidatus Methanovirga aequatorialis]